MSGDTEITGYRKLNAEEIALINEGKALAELVGAYIIKVKAFKSDTGAVDGRWAAIGQTQLQQGFMAVIRSIARPTTF